MLQLASAVGPPARGSAGMGGGLGGFGGAPNLATNTNNPGQTQSTTNTQSTAGSPPLNPFSFDPAMMQQLMGGWGNQGGAGLGSGLFGTPATPAPTDTRPPEERFQTQLQVSIPQQVGP